MGRLDQKVAIITGAANGIGAASATLLASEGAAVVVADIDADGAKHHAETITSAGGTAMAVHVDIADAASIHDMVATTVSAFGGLDILHNNASAMNLTPDDIDILGIDLDVWDATIQTNLRGTMVCSKEAIPHILERGGGSIINTASGQALGGDTGRTAYAATKAAIIQLSRSIATQYGKDGLRCNTVCPGLTLTDRLKKKLDADTLERLLRHQLLRRVGQPEDIANLVLFLVSDAGSFITGQLLICDGGTHAHLPSYAEGGNITRS